MMSVPSESHAVRLLEWRAWSAPRLDCSPWGRKMRQEAPWAAHGCRGRYGRGNRSPAPTVSGLRACVTRVTDHLRTWRGDFLRRSPNFYDRRSLLRGQRVGLRVTTPAGQAPRLSARELPRAFSKSSVRTVPIGVVGELIRSDAFNWGQLMAGALLGSIPSR